MPSVTLQQRGGGYISGTLDQETVLTYLDYDNRMMRPTIRKNKVGGQEEAATSLQELIVGGGFKTLQTQCPRISRQHGTNDPFQLLVLQKG
jgi:hypothetical protein